jgi:hypothetical protein
MAEAEIIVESGVSWLHDHQLAKLKEREEFLKDAMSRGLPYHEYIGFVGRHKECLRQIDDLAELFKDFYQSEETVDNDLEELTDE